VNHIYCAPELRPLSTLLPPLTISAPLLMTIFRTQPFSSQPLTPLFFLTTLSSIFLSARRMFFVNLPSPTPFRQPCPFFSFSASSHVSFPPSPSVFSVGALPMPSILDSFQITLSDVVLVAFICTLIPSPALGTPSYTVLPDHSVDPF